MKTNNIRWGRAVVAGLLATVIGFLVGFVLFSCVNGVYERFGDLPYAKPITSLPLYLLQRIVVGGALTVLWALVYAAIQEGLPGQNKWQKGLAFGLVLIATRVLPGAFNAWMEIAQPGVLILVEMVNNATGVLIVGLVIVAFYGRPGVASQARKACQGAGCELDFGADH